MKKLLIFMLTAILCISALSGCGEMSEEPVDLRVTFSDTLTDFPNEAPSLFIGEGEMRIKAWRGTCSWTIEGEDGLGHGVESDSPHPLDCKESLPVLDLKKKTSLTLSFEGRPTKITVKCYPTDAEDYEDFETIEIKDGAIRAKSGDFVYEIIATWSGEKYSGTVYYAFRTE